MDGIGRGRRMEAIAINRAMRLVSPGGDVIDGRLLGVRRMQPAYLTAFKLAEMVRLNVSSIKKLAKLLALCAPLWLP
jgi:hypothetical protein